MKISDLHNDAGLLTGFAISNTLVGRWRACRVARDIPGAQIRRWPRRWAWDDEPFCEFDIDGAHFIITEPHGDSSQYWVLANPPVHEAIVARVRAAFASAPAFDWHLGAAG
jgi:hypothetical protein